MAVTCALVWVHSFSQTLTLTTGAFALSGQKTLLGVAFLVALASLRNFPIYLMDELDAALDPENQKVSMPYLSQ